MAFKYMLAPMLAGGMTVGTASESDVTIAIFLLVQTMTLVALLARIITEQKHTNKKLEDGTAKMAEQSNHMEKCFEQMASLRERVAVIEKTCSWYHGNEDGK